MISWDEEKRALTLLHRDLDFADAEKVFAGRHVTIVDDRVDYGETRFITAGYLNDRFVVLVWTKRAGGKRIISMRYGHAKESKKFQRYLD
jgi:uncharacterized DUF497 family protein